MTKHFVIIIVALLCMSPIIGAQAWYYLPAEDNHYYLVDVPASDSSPYHLYYGDSEQNMTRQIDEGQGIPTVVLYSQGRLHMFFDNGRHVYYSSRQQRNLARALPAGAHLIDAAKYQDSFLIYARLHQKTDDETIASTEQLSSAVATDVSLALLWLDDQSRWQNTSVEINESSLLLPPCVNGTKVYWLEILPDDGAGQLLSLDIDSDQAEASSFAVELTHNVVVIRSLHQASCPAWLVKVKTDNAIEAYEIWRWEEQRLNVYPVEAEQLGFTKVAAWTSQQNELFALLADDTDDDSLTVLSFDSSGRYQGQRSLSLPVPFPYEWLLIFVSPWASWSVLLSLTILYFYYRRRAPEPFSPAVFPLPLAPWLRRGVALIIDMVPALLFMTWILEILTQHYQLTDQVYSFSQQFPPKDAEAFYRQYSGLLVLLMISYGAFLFFLTGYMIFFEMMWGRSPGKMITGLWIVSIKGKALSPRQIVIRNFLRILELFPRSPLLVLILLFLSPWRQRIGDLVAGSVVIAGPTRSASASIGDK